MSVKPYSVNLVLPAVAARELSPKLRGRSDGWLVEQAMARPDGATVEFEEGRWAFTGHRHIRDGARVALITIPGLLRFDIRTNADSFSFTVRNLSGLPAAGPAHEQAVRPHHRPDGPPLNEYELNFKAPDGRRVTIVARVPPYVGALSNDYSAVAIIG